MPVPRALSSVVGIVALLTAAVGAVELGHEEEVAPMAAPAASVAQPAPVQVRRLEAARRAEVVEASRAYTRPAVDAPTNDEARSAELSATVRARSLDRLATAAEQRSAEIQEAIERRRRIRRMNRWVAPVSGYDISATFGAGGSAWSSDHTGLDFATAEGSPVSSTAAGEVTFAGYDGAYGNKVVVTHDDGTETWYCHLSSITVETGESVDPGTTIGAVGSTGNTTGPHLHLEVRPGGGAPVDPYSYLEEEGAL